MNTMAMFLFWGSFGMAVEIVFTAIVNQIDRKKSGQPLDWGLKGESYIWMFPIYGSIAFLAPPVMDALSEWHWLLRGAVYGVLILAVEYICGLILKLTTGKCPWEYHSRWAVHGFIRLDYFPLWAGFGLMVELISRFMIARTVI